MPQPKHAGRDIISYEEAKFIIDKAKSIRDKALFSILYLLGCRISELTNHYESVTKNKQQKRGKDHVIKGIHKSNILVLEDEVRFLIPTHKKRKSKRKKMIRDDPIRNLAVSRNAPFMDIIISYLATKKEDDILFPITTCRAWQILKECKDDVWLHLFRHTRLTKISQIATNPYEILRWSGHADLKELKPYLALMPVRSFKDAIK